MTSAQRRSGSVRSRARGGDALWIQRPVVVTALAVLPLIFGVFALASSWVPPLDDGYIALRTSDVFSAHPVLTGQRSTASADAGGLQVHHPGPVENYLLAIPYAVSGFHAWGLLLGDLLVITLSLWIAVSVCMRIWRPWWGLLPCLCLWIFVLVGGSRLLLRPWNPTFALVPLMALVFVAAALVRGTPRALRWLPAYAFLASLVAQCHLAFLPVVGAFTLGLGVLGIIRWHARHGRWWPLGGDARGPWWRRPGLIAVGLTVVLWLPSIVEVFVEPPGNVFAMWRYFVGDLSTPRNASGGAVGHVGPFGALNILSNLLIPSGSFTTSSVGAKGSVPPSIVGLCLLVLALGLGARYAWLSRSGKALRCAQQVLVVAAGLLLICWLVLASMSNSRSLIYASSYLPITVTATVALIADGVDWLAWRFRWRAPAAVSGRPAVIATVVAVVVCSWGLSRLAGVDPTTRATNVAEGHMIDAVAGGLRAHGVGDRPVRIDPGDDRSYLRERDTLAWGLDQHGVRVSITFPQWHAKSDDSFRVSAHAPRDAVPLRFVEADVGKSAPRVPADAVVLWRGELPAYASIPDLDVAVYTTSLR